MENVLSYHVFCTVRGWLQDDEKTWGRSFETSATFTAHELAQNIGERESQGDTAPTPYVMACMGLL